MGRTRRAETAVLEMLEGGAPKSKKSMKKKLAASASASAKKVRKKHLSKALTRLRDRGEIVEVEK